MNLFLAYIIHIRGVGAGLLTNIHPLALDLGMGLDRLPFHVSLSLSFAGQGERDNGRDPKGSLININNFKKIFLTMMLGNREFQPREREK